MVDIADTLGLSNTEFRKRLTEGLIKRTWWSNLSATTSNIEGLGVKAPCNIKRGDFVCEYFGTLQVREDLHSLPRKRHSKYRFALNDYLVIEPHQRGKTVAKFLNHSCEPNLVAVRFNLRRNILLSPLECAVVRQPLGHGLREKFNSWRQGLRRLRLFWQRQYAEQDACHGPDPLTQPAKRRRVDNGYVEPVRTCNCDCNSTMLRDRMSHCIRPSPPCSAGTAELTSGASTEKPTMHNNRSHLCVNCVRSLCTVGECDTDAALKKLCKSVEYLERGDHHQGVLHPANLHEVV